MSVGEIRELIDLDRYPLDQPDHPDYARLLREGREALQDGALFSMQQFVRAEAIAPMVRELEAKLPRSCRYDRPRSAYVYSEQQ